MTEIILPTPGNLRRLLMRNLDVRSHAEAENRSDSVSETALMLVASELASMAYASTFSRIEGSPIVLWSVPEAVIVEVLAHEEDHRALIAIGEVEASRSLDDPRVFKLLAKVRGTRVDRSYDRVHSRFSHWNRRKPEDRGA